MPIMDTGSENNIKLFFNTRRHLLLAIVLIWSIVALVFFAIKPQVQTLFVLRSNLEIEKEQYMDISRKIQDLQSIRISDQFQQKEKVDEVLPSYKPVMELLFNLNEAMKESNVGITSLLINPGEIATESAEISLLDPTSRDAATQRRQQRYSALRMELIVSGAEERVDQFLQLVERIAPFTSIVELEINTRTDREGVTRTEAEMLLHTYYYTQTIVTRIDDQLPSIGEKELKAFETIQQFMPSGFQKPTAIQGADLEDLFGIRGFEF